MSGVTVEQIKELRNRTSAGLSLCREALVASNGDMDAAIEFINNQSDVITRLNDLTRAKIGFCETAYKMAEGDFNKAVAIIEEKGWGKAVADGAAQKVEGVIDVYIHGFESKVVSMVELSCVTDFVARNEDFRKVAHEIAVHIVASEPKFVSSSDITEEMKNELVEKFVNDAVVEGKSDDIARNIANKKLENYIEESCLLTQKWFKDESKTIQNLIDDITAKMGEPIKVRRFAIWRVGE